jgi:hypothetical protein
VPPQRAQSTRYPGDIAQRFRPLGGIDRNGVPRLSDSWATAAEDPRRRGGGPVMKDGPGRGAGATHTLPQYPGPKHREQHSGSGLRIRIRDKHYDQDQNTGPMTNLGIRPRVSRLQEASRVTWVMVLALDTGPTGLELALRAYQRHFQS